MDIQSFLNAVGTTCATGNATEHSFRPALQTLLHSIAPNITALNEPRRVACGAPDFLVSRDNTVIGHVEAKTIGTDISMLGGTDRDQQERYRAALPNLIYTNCLAWDFYRAGTLAAQVTIADLHADTIRPRRQDFATLERLLAEFVALQPHPIDTPQDLAERMAGKATLIRHVLSRTLADTDAQADLAGQYAAFRDTLIHDTTPEQFADIYAETLTYGMFAARLHADNPAAFSRQAAPELLPKSGPFLRSLFGYVARSDLDSRIAWIIDDLAHVFRACDMAQILAGFGRRTGQEDPFLHFYETFLGAYDPARKKARGVWYTPEPVVQFIVRAVDELLKDEFGLADGLADTSKVTLDRPPGQEQVHRVQILDPATGTGTFLAEVIRQIAPGVRRTAPALWPDYIENHLIPRLHGFEILMASYAMCHMKLDMILTDLGYTPAGENPPRLSVYLTNSLEQGAAGQPDLPFARWLSREAEGANRIKRDMPIMCVIGNPPYSGHSHNKGDWITQLIEVYKQGPELRKPAQAKWLSDDYVKFIRLSEFLIDRTGEGILGLITNHSYLDNPTFVDMRRHLMQTFDSIYVLDLHGNTRKREVAPDGSKDENVFDIQQGVAILIAIKKKGDDKELARVYRGDLWRSRAAKYATLAEATLATVDFCQCNPEKAPWPFKSMDWELYDTYYGFPGITDWFSQNGHPARGRGIVTTQDQFAISWSDRQARSRIEKFLQTENEAEARAIWRLCSQDQWNYHRAKAGLADGHWHNKVRPITYRPFDTRYTVYDSNVCVHRRKQVMRHMLAGDNICLTIGRQGHVVGSMPWNLVFVNDMPIDLNIFYRGGGVCLPLYLIPDEQTLDTTTRRINFNPALWDRLKDLVAHPDHGTPDELQTFDYIYGTLHAPVYRTAYAEFLKEDYPRIPWPATPDEFWHISAKGTHLRKLHLMNGNTIRDTPYPFTGNGDNVVEKVDLDGDKVWINKTQYFSGASDTEWNFYIGGYKPAQKWLKDRKGRTLTWDDVKHYQNILKILSETDRVMHTITMAPPAR